MTMTMKLSIHMAALHVKYELISANDTTSMILLSPQRSSNHTAITFSITETCSVACMSVTVLMIYFLPN